MTDRDQDVALNFLYEGIVEKNGCWLFRPNVKGVYGYIQSCSLINAKMQREREASAKCK